MQVAQHFERQIHNNAHSVNKSKFLVLPRSNLIEQGYSNGGPRSESGPLDAEVRTSSAYQSCFFTQRCLSQNL